MEPGVDGELYWCLYSSLDTDVQNASTPSKEVLHGKLNNFLKTIFLQYLTAFDSILQLIEQRVVIKLVTRAVL